MATRASTVSIVPDGLLYRPEVVSRPLEHRLIACIEEQDLKPMVLRGVASKRAVRSFGWSYDPATMRGQPGPPMPSELLEARAVAAELCGLPADRFEQVLVSRYPPGAGIGRHRDAPPFGAPIVGLSLGSACRMRFLRDLDGVHYRWALELQPRSGYVLDGPARSAWQHEIPKAADLRWSITFRPLRHGSRWVP